MTTVLLINPFEVPADGGDAEFLAAWHAAADYLRTQPGFVNARLHRALRPDARFRYVNLAEWASPQDFLAAVTSDGFRALTAGLDTGSPALYEVVATIGDDVATEPAGAAS